MTTALRPSIAARLKALEPTTTPTAIACWFSTSAVTADESSGASAASAVRRPSRASGSPSRRPMWSSRRANTAEAASITRDRDEEEWDGGCGRHRLNADQTSRHTGPNASAGVALGSRIRRRLCPLPFAPRRLRRPRGRQAGHAASIPPGAGSPASAAVLLVQVASSSAPWTSGEEDGEKSAEPVGEAHRRRAYAMIGT